MRKVTFKITVVIMLLLVFTQHAGSQNVMLTGPFNVTVCAPLSASFHVQADSGSGNYTYTWYRNNSITNETTATFQINQTDTSINGDRFYCIVGDMGVSYFSDTAMLTVLDCSIQPLLVDAGLPAYICDSSCVQFSPAVTGGVPPYNYQWSPAGGFNNPVFDPSLPTPLVCYYDSVLTQTLYLYYTLTVTDSIGNSASDSVLITVYALPQVDAGPDTNIVQNASVHLNATVMAGLPPYYFMWMPPAGLSNTAIADPVATPLQTTTYTVTLTTNNGCIATDKITIYVNAPVYHNLGGQVFAGLYPIDEGYAELTIVNGNYMNQAGWMTFDTLGYYYFPQQPEANYYVKSEPAAGSSAFGLYAPTYYGDVLNWTSASLIILNTDLFSEDIHLLPVPGPSPGPGNIGGSVFSGAKGDPVVRAEILLKDGTGNVLSYSNTDAWGHFAFSGIAYGTYNLYPEIAGKTASPVTIVLSPGTPDITNLIFTVNENSIASGINETDGGGGFGAGSVFPDPVSDYAYLNLYSDKPVSAFIELITMTGQCVRSEKADIFDHCKLTLDVRDLQSGVYYITIRTAEGNMLRKLIRL